MNFNDFQSGHSQKQFQYDSFRPEVINHAWNWDDPSINTLLEEATRWLGELNAFAKILPDVDFYIRMHVAKEANASSRIEGTQTQMGDLFKDETQIQPEKRDDWQEVQNYIRATNRGIEALEDFPLSMRLICQAHETLMQGVRGEHKTPGEIRRSQNWIGGTSLKDAIFIPPHHEELGELLSDLEKFWHNEYIQVPHLIRIAISHYQFETIHPFLDGNGRLGRLLITLYLNSHGLLEKPCLYLSSFLEKNKGAYYNALTTVRQSNDISHWIKFFLNAVAVTAKSATETFREIMDLKKEMDQIVLSLGRKAINAQKMLEFLYKNPVVTIASFENEVNISRKSIQILVNNFVNLGILVEQTGKKRKRLYVFEKYFQLFD